MFINDEISENFERGLDKMDKNRKKLLVAYELSGLNINTACKAANVPRSSWYNWMNNDWVFAMQVEILQEGILDMAKSKLLEKINGIYKYELDEAGNFVYDEKGKKKRTDEYQVLPSLAAIIFMLERKGKKLGYGRPAGKDGSNSNEDDENTGAVIIDWRGQVSEDSSERSINQP